MRERPCIRRSVPTYTYYSLLPVPHYYLAESISEEEPKTEKAALSIQLVMELQIAFKCRHCVCVCMWQGKSTRKEYKEVCLWVHLHTHTRSTRATKHGEGNRRRFDLICTLAGIGWHFHCVSLHNSNGAFQSHYIVQEILTFPGSSLERGTLRKHLFKDRLCRIEFCRERDRWRRTEKGGGRSRKEEEIEH